MKNIPMFNNTQLPYEMSISNKESYEQGYSDGRASMVEELESLKVEMDNKGWYNRHDRKQFAEIIDKKIAEMKGETNE